MKEVKISEENILVKCCASQLLDIASFFMRINATAEEEYRVYEEFGWYLDDLNKILEASQQYKLEATMPMKAQIIILEQMMKEQKIEIWRK